ncbi:PAS domain-containing protein [Priestia aryabhattai]|uniref:PAS domain-containing protein n=1 Tax=Priestia aryabhattai TaxID=412384 RepID=UPI00088441B7|nr:PAS domain S-box-containing protein [Priestia aryabhattai B8W22]
MTTPEAHDSKWSILNKALHSSQSGIIVTDPSLPDNPIIYLNQGFSLMTGYKEDEVLGENCRFLQGPLTNPHHVDEIRSAISRNQSVSVTLVNYRKDGSFFHNQLTIDPTYIEEEDKYYFIGVQKDVTIEITAQEQLQQALEEVERLSTPIVPIEEGISVIPLIGTLSERRTEMLFNSFISRNKSSKDRYLILDVSGLARFNDSFGRDILNIYNWLKLMGTQLVLTGISPNMAIHMSTIEDDMSFILVYQSIKGALRKLKL